MKSPFTYKHLEPMELVDNMPAIFLLHGMGSNEEDLPQLVQDFRDTHHLFSLRGPIVHTPGYAFFTIEEEGKPERHVFDQIILHIQAFIREAISEYKLDPSKIVILGFSQGAVLAQTLGITMGKEIQAVVALSGYLPDFVRDEYRKSAIDHLKIFISHGDYDYIIPPIRGVESKAYFEDAGAEVTFKTYGEGHGVVPENHRDLVAFLKSI